jgi:hypothetical protein
MLAFRNFAIPPKKEVVVLHLLHSVKCRVPSIPSTQTVYRVWNRFRPTDGLCFWRSINLFSHQIFPAAMPSFHWVQKTNVCRRHAVRPFLTHLRWLPLNVQYKMQAPKKLWEELKFVHVGPVWPPVSRYTRNRALSILTLTNTRRIRT